ncbi:hypothetical protein, partial [Nocardioides sp. AX2bis]|uniref:hypothetical protein n=1 Tax=Nocardioides sp. AX2bis TaxID=2653157 RepID=UPI001916487A
MAGGTRDPGPAPEEPTDANDPVDGSVDGSGDGSGDGPAVPGRPADDDAAWAAIVANFGDRATLEEPGPTRPEGSEQHPAGTDPARLRRLFEPFDRPAPRAGEGRDPQTRADDPDADLGKAPDA